MDTSLLASLKDRFLNDPVSTCIIIANGPGLADIPLALLKKYPTFGTNRIYLLPNFTSTFYVVTNDLVIEQSKQEISDYPSEYKFIKNKNFKAVHVPFFCTNLLRGGGINEGGTVTYVCLQLAYWVGFRTVLIVGLDHYYSDRGIPNAQDTKTKTDQDHFTSNYFPPGTVWNYPDLELSEKAYRKAKEVYKKNTRRIINISTKTACTIFPRKSHLNYL